MSESWAPSVSPKRTLIIAEAGINHGKSLTKALKLCDAAKECGTDVVKHQLEYPSEHCLTYDEMLKVYEHCVAIGIPFACTAFDADTLKWLLENTVMEFIKLPSIDFGNPPWILRCIARESNIPVIQSLPPYCVVDKIPDNWKCIHVVPEYPTPLEHSNLKRVAEPWCSGLSDHSGNPLIPALAVALGAKIIECHLKLSDEDIGPDMSSSLNPEQFKLMVRYVRDAECAIGATR